jgi:hypothetical protein
MLKEKNVDETVATLVTTSNELRNKSNTMPKSLPVKKKQIFSLNRGKNYVKINTASLAHSIRQPFLVSGHPSSIPRCHNLLSIL